MYASRRARAMVAQATRGQAGPSRPSTDNGIIDSPCPNSPAVSTEDFIAFDALLNHVTPEGVLYQRNNNNVPKKGGPINKKRPKEQAVSRNLFRATNQSPDCPDNDLLYAEPLEGLGEDRPDEGEGSPLLFVENDKSPKSPESGDKNDIPEGGPVGREPELPLDDLPIIFADDGLEIIVIGNGNSENASEVLIANDDPEGSPEPEVLLDLDDPDGSPEGDKELLVENIGSPESAEIQTKTRKRRAPSPTIGTPKRRKRNPANWKSVIAKEAHAKGIAHTSLRGKAVAAKELGPGCSDTCSYKCHSNVSQEERQSTFKSYYSIPETARKWDLIARLVTVVPVKRRSTDEDTSRRKHTLVYNLQLRNNSKVQVCKKFFLDTIAQNESVVRTAVLTKQKNKGPTISADKRGKYQRKTIVGSIIKSNVKAHISSFKPVESHYCRKSSKCTYLPESLNVRKMHSMYLMAREKNAPHSASLRQYRDVFRSEYNIKFLKPKKDQCANCINWKNKTQEEKSRPGAQEKHELHVANKMLGFQLKEADSKRAKAEETVCTVSMDFQQILQCPKGNNGDFYYKSKLKCYNFSMFEHDVKQGTCFVWDQTVGGKGSKEVCSCVLKFIEDKAKAGVKKLIIWSDNCWSQNKNKQLFGTYNMASFKYDIEITHRYLEKGHTHMEVDSMHALIEKTSKNIDIYTPSQWYAIMAAAKKTVPRYKVIQMKLEDFKNFDELVSHHTWSTKMKISQLREIVVYKNDVYIKHNYSDAPEKLNIQTKQKGRPVKWETFTLKNAYKHKFVIPSNQLEDLKWFIKKDHIPSACVPFYEALFQSQDELHVNNNSNASILNPEETDDACDTCEEADNSSEDGEGGDGDD